MASANKTPIFNLPQWQGNEYMERLDWNQSFQTIENAMATVDYLAGTYGYSLSISEADGTTTTTLTVDASAPVTALRKTVETISDDATTYAVTVTIGDESLTMTHTIGQATGSGVSA